MGECRDSMGFFGENRTLCPSMTGINVTLNSLEMKAKNEMTELELYKFLYDDNGNVFQEPRWYMQKGREDKLLVWLNYHAIQEFIEFVGEKYICSAAMTASLQYTCFVLDLVPICQYFEINPEKICKK